MKSKSKNVHSYLYVQPFIDVPPIIYLWKCHLDRFVGAGYENTGNTSYYALMMEKFSLRNFGVSSRFMPEKILSVINNCYN
jgi:hypothetical protein